MGAIGVEPGLKNIPLLTLDFTLARGPPLI